MYTSLFAPATPEEQYVLLWRRDKYGCSKLVGGPDLVGGTNFSNQPRLVLLLSARLIMQQLKNDEVSSCASNSPGIEL